MGYISRVGCASRLRLAHAIFAVSECPGFRVQAADGQHTLRDPTKGATIRYYRIVRWKDKYGSET
jgi:hypothetical protein